VCGPRAGLTRSSGHATRAALPRVAGTTSHTVAHPTHKKHHTKKHHTKKHHHAKRHHKSRTHHGATYRVHSGDTLAKIAHKLRVHGGWHALYRANRSHMSNPNVLYVGQVLRLP
jgi:nucleoid-associated protein YgaU